MISSHILERCIPVIDNVEASSKTKSLSLTASIEFLLISVKPNFLASNFLSILNLVPDKAAEPRGIIPILGFASSNLEKSLELLLDGSAFQFAHKFITISSSGLPDLMVKFSKRFPQVGVALSLNAADDETRVQVMPVNEKFPMKVLRETLEEMEEIRQSGVMIEYIMFKGVNDSLEDAKKVAEFLRGLDVHINLIPYNPDLSDVKGFFASNPEDIIAFQDYLKDEGYKVTRRFSLGQDIAAACGQLANNETIEK